MNEINIRRSKIKREITNRHKQEYFQHRRTQLLSTINLIEEETPQAALLRELITRSLVENQLIPDLRNHSLLEKLDQLLQSTNQGRVVQLLLVVWGNLLLDNISLDEKEQIAKACLWAYKKECFIAQLRNRNECNLTFNESLVHNLSSLCTALHHIDQDLAIECEKAIMKHAVETTQQVVDFIAGKQLADSHVWSIVERICAKISQLLLRLLYSQPEYRAQIRTRFHRNSAFFFNLLESHFRLRPYVASSPAAQILHEGFFCVENQLSKIIDMADFPLYFQTKLFVAITITELFKSRDHDCTQMALQILSSLLVEYEKINIYAILQLVQSTISELGPEEFYRRILHRDSLVLKRLSLLQIWICSEGQFKTLNSFVQGQWRHIVDICLEVVRLNKSYEELDSPLRLLIVLSQKIGSHSERAGFLLYLESVGGEALLEEINSHLTQQNNHRGDQQLQSILQMIYVLLDMLRAP